MTGRINRVNVVLDEERAIKLQGAYASNSRK